ncbi:MAG: hypothetical protein ACLR8P_23330 [Clostridium fessum]
MKKGRGDQDMNKKAWKAGAVSAMAVGAGLAAAAISRKKAGKWLSRLLDYRNTERGKQAKNSKGIYYSSGNYEAFARPEKPEGIEGKSAIPGWKWLGFIWQRPVFWYGMARCRENIFIFWRPWTLQAVPATVLTTRSEAM